jgi:hypothetical protein
VQLEDQSQSELRVARDTHAIETLKEQGSCFSADVFLSLFLVPMKRVLGVPLANEISELRARARRVDNHEAYLRVV